MVHPDFQCVHTPAAIVSRVPYEQLIRETGEDPSAGLTAFQHTGARDRIEYPGNRRVWFQAHTGGAGNGEYAQYDAASHVLARCAHYDTAQAVIISQAAAAPPPVPRGAMTFASRRGLHIGSSAADVQRVYGKTKARQTDAGAAYAYERAIPVRGSSLPFVKRTIFFVRNNRVVAIVRLEGF